MREMYRGKGLLIRKVESVPGTRLLVLPIQLQLANFSRGVNGARRQAMALQGEGVRVERGSMGEYTVDLMEYGWFPSVLPSEAAQVEDSESEDLVVDDSPA
jgi:hypothetical protein